MESLDNDITQEDFIFNFASNLRYLREEANLTQTDLSKLSGLAPTAISHFECGRRIPSVRNLVRLSKALNVSTDILLGIGE